eukprot:TRINITY_DN1437_c0_g1_i5.p1 TRINITY_DN1437_c0_g1~~TRINITY_DN1437_c0_g1_i5.p1  ORF type:complete len:144 (+),score=18.68 TRINITY_DN1437_c0_g1_i5:43-474(+)
MTRRRLGRLESIEPRPCQHNDWDDVRTRKGYKVLRCRECQQRWKIPSTNVPRCVAYFNGRCQEGCGCVYLHVRWKKSAESEASAKDTVSVLDLVPPNDILAALSQCTSESPTSPVLTNPYMPFFAPPSLGHDPTYGWYCPIEA